MMTLFQFVHIFFLTSLSVVVIQLYGIALVVSEYRLIMDDMIKVFLNCFCLCIQDECYPIKLIKRWVLSLRFTTWWRLSKSHTTVFGVCPFRKSHRIPVVNVSVSGTWNDYHFNMTHSHFPVTFKRLPVTGLIELKMMYATNMRIIVVIINNKIMYESIQEVHAWLYEIYSPFLVHECFDVVFRSKMWNFMEDDFFSQKFKSNSESH